MFIFGKICQLHTDEDEEEETEMNVVKYYMNGAKGVIPRMQLFSILEVR